MALLWSKNNRVTKSWALLVTSPHHWSINTVTNAGLAGMWQASNGFVMCHVFFRILPLQRFDSKEIWVQVYFYLSRNQNTLALRAIKRNLYLSVLAWKLWYVWWLPAVCEWCISNLIWLQALQKEPRQCATTWKRHFLAFHFIEIPWNAAHWQVNGPRTADCRLTSSSRFGSKTFASKGIMWNYVEWDVENWDPIRRTFSERKKQIHLQFLAISMMGH